MGRKRRKRKKRNDAELVRKAVSRQFGPSKYDTEMVREFIEHMTWELRIMHFEITHPDAEPNPELSSQLGKYVSKWNTPGLFPALFMNPGNASAGELAEVSAHVRRVRGGQEQAWLDALDTLRPAFNIAFQCAQAGRATLDVRYADESLQAHHRPEIDRAIRLGRRK